MGQVLIEMNFFACIYSAGNVEVCENASLFDFCHTPCAVFQLCRQDLLQFRSIGVGRFCDFYLQIKSSCFIHITKSSSKTQEMLHRNYEIMTNQLDNENKQLDSSKMRYQLEVY